MQLQRNILAFAVWVLAAVACQAQYSEPESSRVEDSPGLLSKMGSSMKSSFQSVFHGKAKPSAASPERLCENCDCQCHQSTCRVHGQQPSTTPNYASTSQTARSRDPQDDLPYTESGYSNARVMLAQANYAQPVQPTWEEIEGAPTNDAQADLRTSPSQGEWPEGVGARGRQPEPPALGGPTISGKHLNQGQMTATEHALVLSDKLKELQAAYSALTAYNERLEEQLLQKTKLMGEMEKAVDGARTELERSNSENRRLLKELQSTQTEFANYKQQAARLLDTIKSELDDALVRQIVVEDKSK